MGDPVRIFVSTSSDVGDERLRAAHVISRLKRKFSRALDLDAVFWEDQPKRGGQHFQDQLPDPACFDVVVSIFWSRLGVPLPADRYRGLDGRVPVTGTEWEFEQALQSLRDKQRPTLLVFKKEGVSQPNTRAAPDPRKAVEEWRAQLDAFEAFWARHFVERGGFKQAYEAFKTAEEFERTLETMLERTLREDFVARERASDRRVWTEGAPFRGLAAFGFERAPIFFGREAATRQVARALVERARGDCAFLLVLGASGSGKSSLVQAGVLPDLMHPGVEHVDVWRRCVFRPSEGLGDLVGGLVRKLAEAPHALPELVTKTATAEDRACQLARGDVMPVREALARAAAAQSEALRKEEPVAHLILVVDQMEELLTQFGDDDAKRAQRDDLVRLMAALARDKSVWVVGTMRSDFFPRLAELPALLKIAQGQGQFLLVPPTPAEIGAIIREPARAALIGYEPPEDHPPSPAAAAAPARIDAGENSTADEIDASRPLDEAIEADAAGQSDVLPLLEFALDELFRRDIEKGGGKVMTRATYKSVGRLKGAIGTYAESVHAALTPAEKEAFAPLLLRLVRTEGLEEAVASRTVPLAELAPGETVRALIGRLVDARLLVSDRSSAGPALRIAHEALLTHWETAKAIIVANREFLAARGRVEQAAADWRRDGGRNDRLLPPRTKALVEAEGLLARRGELAAETAAFIERSLAAATEVRRRRNLVRNAVTAALAALAIGAGAAAYVAMESRDAARASADEARRQRDVAQRNLQHALAAADTLVSEIAGGMKDTGMPAALVRAVLQRAEALLDALEDAGDDPAIEQRRARMLHAFVDAYLVLGETAEARKRASAAVAIAECLAARDPSNVEWHHDLAESYHWLGRVLQGQNHLVAALKAYRDAFAIARRLAARDPSNTQWQHQLSVSYGKIGDVLEAQGDLVGALKAYHDGLAIAEHIAARDPSNNLWQNNLSRMYMGIGDVLQAQGDRASALKAYRDGLAIAERLAARDPSNTRWQRSLYVSYVKIADALLKHKALAGALDAYRDGLAIAERLVARDPSNTEWQRDLFLIHSRIGWVAEAQKELAAAKAAYLEAKSIIDALVAKNPGNAQWRGDRDWIDARLKEIEAAAATSR